MKAQIPWTLVLGPLEIHWNQYFSQAMPVPATLHVICHHSIQQPFGGRCHYSHFTDVKSEVQRIINVPKFLQLKF